MDSHCHAKLAELVVLNSGLKIPGIHKIHGVNLSVFIARPLFHKRDKRMVLVAGFSPHGFHAELSAAYRHSLYLTLPRPGAVKGHHVKILVVHIQTGAVNLCKIQGFLSAVDNAHASGDDVRLLKGRIQKDGFQPSMGIPAQNFHAGTLILPAKGRRKTRKTGLSFINFAGDKLQGQARVSSLCLDADAVLPVIPQTVGGIFHGKAVQKGSALPVMQ